ncbi:HAD family hydrolase [Salinibius halmophilus]|uniref:HAD family hydrolase n=1 Tax=Salinibius halmophilus TaxID=1853216 RepID=UPI000E66A6AD|nr:HAD family hydrolase [Salinibius halmophilus]
MTISAVLFDLDNTLMHRENTVRAFAPVLQNYFRELLGDEPIAAIEAALLEADNGGYLDPNLGFDSLREQVGRLMIRAFPQLSDVGDERIGDYWQEVFTTCAQPMPNMATTLATLADQYDLAVLSNGPENSRLKSAQGLNLTMPVYATGRIGIHKPNAGAFASALNDLGWQAEQVVYVGDHPVNDYQGAKNAGLTPIWVEGFHQWPHDQPAKLAISDLAELPSLLASL